MEQQLSNYMSGFDDKYKRVDNENEILKDKYKSLVS